MGATRIFLQIVAIAAAEVVAHDFCPIEKQPFIDYAQLGKGIGRWYTIERLNPYEIPNWGGEIHDFYEENGKVFMNITLLTKSGKCNDSAIIGYRHNPEKPEEFEYFIDGKLGGYAYTAGGDYNAFAVIYVCNKNYMKEGACQKPMVYIWSRTKSLSASNMAKARSLMNSLCFPDDMYTHTSTGVTDCLLEEPNEKICENKFIPYMSSFDIKQVLTRWYLMALYYHKDDVPGVDLIGATMDFSMKKDKVVLSNHFAVSTECQAPGPITVKTLIPGKIIELGGIYNGTITYVFDTDYDNYAILWICRGYQGDVCIFPHIRLWTRKPILSPMTLRKAREAAKFLCNPSDELLMPAAIYETCPPPKKVKIPKCQCQDE